MSGSDAEEETKKEVTSPEETTTAPTPPSAHPSQPKAATTNNNNTTTAQQENDAKNKRYAMILICLIVLVAAGVAVGVTFAVKRNREEKDEPPDPLLTPPPGAGGIPTATPMLDTPAPTLSPSIFLAPGQLTPEDQGILLDVFASVVGEEVYMTGTSQALAAEWIFFQDPRRLASSTITRTTAGTKLLDPIEEEEFLQRYLLVFFYFITTNNRQTDWLSCGAPPSLSSSSGIMEDNDDIDCTFQKLIPPPYDGYDNNNGDPPPSMGQQLVYTEIPWIRWLTGAHECDWAGVSCVTIDGLRRVTDIDLAGQELQGRLVSELMGLSNLQSLILSYNQFTGILFPDYGRLVIFDVAYNQISGSIPESMFLPSVTLLERFNVGANDLEGVLPISLSFATTLRQLFVFDNNLVGEIPQVLGQLALESFQAQRNNLNGRIPLDSNNVAWASTLEQFWVQENRLTGELPTEVANFVRLEELRLSSNALRGTIPEALYDATTLVRLHLDSNSFTATISPRLNQLTSLEIFDVSYNSLFGPMTDVSGMENLEVIRIQFNQLSGIVPTSTCILFEEGAGNLEILEADCLPAFNPPMRCECCTSCCNRQTQTCGVPDGGEVEEAIMTALRAFILQKFGSTIDLTPGSPHDLAIRWIGLVDPAQLTIASSTFVQRYILTVFYYSTAPWRSCNPPDDPNEVSCIYEMFVRNPDDSIGFEPVPATRWLSATSECDWVGVICSFGDVIGVDLFGQELSGPIPTELMLLPEFARLQLAYNMLTGTIPSKYGSLPNLSSFQVHGNMITGTLPVTFFEANNDLTVIITGDNFISGTLPSQVGLATSLRGIHIFSNNLTGTIPNSFYELPNLAFARLSENRFSGTLVPFIPNTLPLQEFWLHSNQLSGTLPSGLVPLGFSLRDFRLQENNLSGTIPPEMGLLTRLESLRLDSNFFVGTIPSELGIMTSMEAFRLSTNALSGTVPTEFVQMRNLILLWLHRNNLVGSIPDGICSLPFLRFLQTDCIELECACCSACCVDDDDSCFEI